MGTFTRVLFALLLLTTGQEAIAGDTYNPIADTDWNQMTQDVGFSGACTCKNKGILLGVKFHYWEPIATIEVVRKPWGIPSLGIPGSNKSEHHGSHGSDAHEGRTHSFYQVHYVKYPVLAVFQLASLVACASLGSIDLGYMAEIDPTWNDEDLALLMDFQALLTNNPIAQLACLPDVLQASGAAAAGGKISVLPAHGVTQQQAGNTFLGAIKNSPGNANNANNANNGNNGNNGSGTSKTTKVQMAVPITNWFFWCAGGWGSMLPASGFDSTVTDQTQAAALMAARALYKMQKYAMLWGTDSEWLRGVQNANSSSDYCSPYPMPHQFLIKDKYRLNIASPLAAKAQPIGTLGPMWEIGKGVELKGYVFVVWRYRKCCLNLGALL